MAFPAEYRIVIKSLKHEKRYHTVLEYKIWGKLQERV